MIAEFEKCLLSGKINAPPSKSMAHRYLILSAFSKGESIINNIALSEDIKATINCLTSLGAEISVKNKVAKIKGIESILNNKLFCNESGSTLRFLIPYALSLNKKICFTGAERLFKRPLSVYEEIAKDNGFLFEKDTNSLTLKGSLKGGEFTVDGNISSQFISGLLFVLPMLDTDSTIKITPPFESKSYIYLTLSSMEKFGVKVLYDDMYTFKIKGRQSYKSQELTVEGDFSNSAYLEGFNLSGSDIMLSGLDFSSYQGDKVYKNHFESLKNESPVIDISDCPDLGPVLFAVSTINNGATFIGTKRLKIKESDRANAMKEELLKFGCEILVQENSVTVKKTDLKKPTEILNAHNDHRILMALCILLSVTGGKIEGAESVLKSFPDYFDQIKKLNAKVTVYDS